MDIKARIKELEQRIKERTHTLHYLESSDERAKAERTIAKLKEELKQLKNTVKQQEQDAINPKHYNRLSPEPKDVIHNWDLNFNLGNAVKYIARAGHKGDAVEDLKKAQTYIQFEIDALLAGEKPEPVKKEDITEFQKKAMNLYNAYLYHLDKIRKVVNIKKDTECVFSSVVELKEGFDPEEVLEDLSKKLMEY